MKPFPKDFWNYKVHPITGHFLLEHERDVELYSYDKYFILPIVLRNEYGKCIQINPFNILTDNIETA